MSDRKKGKKRKEDSTSDDAADKPSKEEVSIAKWMRGNVPIKKTKFLNHNVEYFTASKAIDALMESQWAKGDEPLFTSREEAVVFLNVMLLHKFFHRARKVPVSDSELKNKKKDKKKEGDSEDDKKKESDKISSKGQNKEEDKAAGDTDNKTEGKKDGNKEKDKRKRKIRLDMHADQRFVDGLDAYVWIYEPIPFYYWVCGTLIVLGVIGVCLFPLWPPTVRLGVYYLSVAAAGFLVFLIALVVLRLIIFCLVWLITFGKHHIWILPNLTEDVGFFASFWPLYTYEYKGGNKDSSDGKSSNKAKRKEKDSDEEDEKDKTDGEILNVKNEEELQKDQVRQRKSKKSATDDVAPSESESESSQKSSTGKDFEIVDKVDIDS